VPHPSTVKKERKNYWDESENFYIKTRIAQTGIPLCLKNTAKYVQTKC
jgi:hypothetical protein